VQKHASCAVRKGMASRLRCLRIEALLSQEQLALGSGVSRSTIAKLEGGGGNPRLDTLFSICGVLGCELFQLVPLHRLAAILDQRLAKR
jgi:transcriptional regulator with XRE-family HTH domain